MVTHDVLLDRAVVIGASIGGLLAARVLAERAREVVILERDALPDEPVSRRGVPQARHAHGLLAGGLGAMEQLLPGLTDQLLERGAVAADLQERCSWINEGRPLSDERSGLDGLLVSRVLLEDQVRRRVLALENVHVRSRTGVVELEVDAARRVVGVRAVDDCSEQLIPADLVVDASGRASRAPAWLAALGFGEPRVEEVAVGVTYATREFVRTDPDAEARNIVINSTAQHPRAGVLLIQPGGRWIATIAGYLGDTPPGDLEGFRAFAATLPSRELADALVGLAPIGDARTFRFPASRWRRYDRMHRFPEGFVVFGDAICSFNPIYGQGMTVVAREAVALQRCLDRHGLDRLARRFLRAARREIAVPWDLAATSDLRLPGVEGASSLKTRLSNRYLPHYFRAAEHDAVLARSFLEVLNLLARPESLMTPAKLARVLRARRRPVGTARDVEPVRAAA